MIDEHITLAVLVLILQEAVFLHVHIALNVFGVELGAQFIIWVAVGKLVVEVHQPFVALQVDIVPRMVELHVVIVGGVEIAQSQVVVAPQLPVLYGGIRSHMLQILAGVLLVALHPHRHRVG